jgi:hypothetical protein
VFLAAWSGQDENRSVRLRWVLLIALALFVGCGSGTNVHHAEVLTTPFPGTLLSFDARQGKCSEDGCPFRYRVQITNPTDGDASVQRCLLQTPRLGIPVMALGGADVPARATTTVTAYFLLPIQKDMAAELVGRDVTCTGLDWHGNAPI